MITGQGQWECSFGKENISRNWGLKCDQTWNMSMKREIGYSEKFQGVAAVSPLAALTEQEAFLVEWWRMKSVYVEVYLWRDENQTDRTSLDLGPRDTYSTRRERERESNNQIMGESHRWTKTIPRLVTHSGGYWWGKRPGGGTREAKRLKFKRVFII